MKGFGARAENAVILESESTTFKPPWPRKKYIYFFDAIDLSIEGSFERTLSPKKPQSSAIMGQTVKKEGNFDKWLYTLRGCLLPL